MEERPVERTRRGGGWGMGALRAASSTWGVHSWSSSRAGQGSLEMGLLLTELMPCRAHVDALGTHLTHASCVLFTCHPLACCRLDLRDIRVISKVGPWGLVTCGSGCVASEMGDEHT